MADAWLGIDVGGANLKGATSCGWSRSLPFPLWKQPGELRNGLLELVAAAPSYAGWAVTMTGELADCFRTRREGVAAIVRAVEDAARSPQGNKSTAPPVRYWSLDRAWCDAAAAIAEPMSVAAANWHGLATWVASTWPTERGLLVDCGSTTTDLIPYGAHGVLATGRTDLQRLRAGELVYVGGRRTPLAMLAPEIAVNASRLRVPAELFATTLDLGLITVALTGDEEDLDTANGRPATRAEALHRVARQLCADMEEVDEATVHGAADWWLAEARRVLADALSRGHSGPHGEPSAAQPAYERVVVGGSGAWLAEKVLDGHLRTKSAQRVPLAEVLPAGCSESACAYALACLAANKC